MSIPRIDPNFTVAELSKIGEEFLDAGRRYWEAAHRAGINGAVIWLTSSSGEFALFTRGEYRHIIMQNIEPLGAMHSFGTVGDCDA
jgi:hypothetical protein